MQTNEEILNEVYGKKSHAWEIKEQIIPLMDKARQAGREEAQTYHLDADKVAVSMINLCPDDSAKTLYELGIKKGQEKNKLLLPSKEQVDYVLELEKEIARLKKELEERPVVNCMCSKKLLKEENARLRNALQRISRCPGNCSACYKIADEALASAGEKEVK